MAKDSTNTPTTAKRTKKSTSFPEKVKNLMLKLQKWVTDTLAELKKVTWPSRKDLIGYTSLVIVFVLAVTAVIALFDWPLSAIMKNALR